MLHVLLQLLDMKDLFLIGFGAIAERPSCIPYFLFVLFCLSYDIHKSTERLWRVVYSKLVEEMCCQSSWMLALQSSFTMSAAFSAIIIVGALVLPETMTGITEASTTRRPSTPRTLREMQNNTMIYFQGLLYIGAQISIFAVKKIRNKKKKKKGKSPQYAVTIIQIPIRE